MRLLFFEGHDPFVTCMWIYIYIDLHPLTPSIVSVLFIILFSLLSFHFLFSFLTFLCQVVFLS